MFGSKFARSRNSLLVTVLGGALLSGAAFGAAFFATKSAGSLPKSGIVSKELAGAVNVTGNYKISGSGPDGKQYVGSAGVTKIAGEMYKGTWSIGSTNFNGICFRDEDVLSCGWSAKHDLGVMAYLVKDNNDLDGVWFEENHNNIGHEYLVGGNANLLGTYTIKNADTPEKQKYTGSVDIGISHGIYNLSWTIGKHKFKGLALRNGDVLTAGFNDSGEFGVLQYRIKQGGKVLSGQWAQTSSASQGPGIETMIKNF